MLSTAHHTWKSMMAMRAVVERSSSTAGSAARMSSRAAGRSTCGHSTAQRSTARQFAAGTQTALRGKAEPHKTAVARQSGATQDSHPSTRTHTSLHQNTHLCVVRDQAARAQQRLQLGLPVHFLARSSVGLLQPQQRLPAFA
jgi:hypothetical protein